MVRVEIRAVWAQLRSLSEKTPASREYRARGRGSNRRVCHRPVPFATAQPANGTGQRAEGKPSSWFGCCCQGRNVCSADIDGEEKIIEVAVAAAVKIFESDHQVAATWLGVGKGNNVVDTIRIGGGLGCVNIPATIGAVGDEKEIQRRTAGNRSKIIKIAGKNRVAGTAAGIRRQAAGLLPGAGSVGKNKLRVSAGNPNTGGVKTQGIMISGTFAHEVNADVGSGLELQLGGVEQHG